ncbi:MAG: acetyltransferase [Raineya sp.]
MTPLLLFPFGSNSIEALDCINQTQYQVLGFVDDDTAKVGKSYLGIRVFDREAFSKFADAKVLACIGSPQNYQIRGQIIAGLGLRQERFVNIIHQKAHVSSFSQIGTNCLIMAGVVITHNAKIGNNAIILPNAVIHHDVEIGDNVFVGASAVICGGVKIKNNCFIGAGSSLINHISIEENSFVGLGANVIQSVAKGKKVVGNPAKEIP